MTDLELRQAMSEAMGWKEIDKSWGYPLLEQWAWGCMVDLSKHSLELVAMQINAGWEYAVDGLIDDQRFVSDWVANPARAVCVAWLKFCKPDEERYGVM